jgi:uncharacterized protein YceH (UPF0502 family)
MSEHETPDDSHSEAEDESSPEALLDPIEARVLGSLMEKKYTTPNSYPMTLNSLVQACNQKTSRDPVMHLDPGQVGRTLNHLRDRKLVYAEFAGRTERYDEKLSHHLLLDRRLHALMCSLLLRGPQTPGELRINASRMAEFEDMNAVHEAVERLKAKKTPLITKLPRLPGKREERYAHLLCGEVDEAVTTAAGSPAAAAIDTRTDVRADERISQLEAGVAGLRSELDALWRLTGLQDQRPTSNETGD